MTVAVLLIVRQETLSYHCVGEVSLMVFTAPGGISPKLHETTPAVIVQEAASVPPTDQLRSAAVGRGSVSVTLLAVPSPLLVTAIVKPTGSPELTVS